jgi:hypothetical protein
MTTSTSMAPRLARKSVRNPSLNTTRAQPNAPGHRLTLAWRRVEAVVVPELHLARSPGFATRYRACGYAARHLENTEEITRAVCADSGFVLAELNGDSDHVHLLANLPPQCRYPGW